MPHDDAETDRARPRIGNPDKPPLEEPLSQLERQLITSYLAALGFDYHALVVRHDEHARKLLADAALHASERLSEIESRSRYVHNLHGEE